MIRGSVGLEAVLIGSDHRGRRQSTVSYGCRSGRRPTAGIGEVVGIVGTTASSLEPEGIVFVWREYWSARSEAPVPGGAKVGLRAVKGLRLRVRPAPPEPQ